MDKFSVLQQYFGHSSFRPGQEQVVDAIVSGQDVLGIGRLVVPAAGRLALLRTGRAAPADWAWAGVTGSPGAALARPRTPRPAALAEAASI